MVASHDTARCAGLVSFFTEVVSGGVSLRISLAQLPDDPGDRIQMVPTAASLVIENELAIEFMSSERRLEWEIDKHG